MKKMPAVIQRFLAKSNRRLRQKLINHEAAKMHELIVHFQNKIHKFQTILSLNPSFIKKEKHLLDYDLLHTECLIKYYNIQRGILQ